jgi:hypothetical protein
MLMTFALKPGLGPQQLENLTLDCYSVINIRPQIPKRTLCNFKMVFHLVEHMIVPINYLGIIMRLIRPTLSPVHEAHSS